MNLTESVDMLCSMCSASMRFMFLIEIGVFFTSLISGLISELKPCHQRIALIFLKGHYHKNIVVVMLGDIRQCVTIVVTLLFGKSLVKRNRMTLFISAYFLAGLCSFRNFLGWLAGWLTKISRLIGCHRIGLRLAPSLVEKVGQILPLIGCLRKRLKHAISLVRGFYQPCLLVVFLQKKGRGLHNTMI